MAAWEAATSYQIVSYHIISRYSLDKHILCYNML